MCLFLLVLMDPSIGLGESESEIITMLSSIVHALEISSVGSFLDGKLF